MSRLSASHGRESVNNNQRRKVSSLNYDGAKLSAAGCQPTMWMINTIAAITNKQPLSLLPPRRFSLSGRKSWVSTRGKCSNSPISLLEWTRRLLLQTDSQLSWFLLYINPKPVWPGRGRSGGRGCGAAGVSLFPPHPTQSKQFFLPTRYYAEHTRPARALPQGHFLQRLCSRKRVFT